MKKILINFNRDLFKEIEDVASKEFLTSQTLIKQVIQKFLRNNNK